MTENGMELRGVARASPNSVTWRSVEGHSIHGLSVWRTNMPQGVVVSVSRLTTFREADAAAAWRKCVDTLGRHASYLAVFHNGLIRTDAPGSPRPFNLAVVLSERLTDPDERRSIMLECVAQRAEAVFTVTYRVSPAERWEALERQWAHAVAGVVQRTRPHYRLGSGETGTLATFRLYGCQFHFDASDADPQAGTGYFRFDLTRSGRVATRAAHEVSVIGEEGDRSMLTIDAGPLARADRILLTDLLRILGRRCEAARAG
jgi:hypothetical protein